MRAASGLGAIEGLAHRLELARLGLAGLARHLGTGPAVAVALRLALREARGAPWQDLPPPVDGREAASREQIGPAVVLHDLLARRLGPERATAVVGEVVEHGALAYLRRVVPAFERDEYDALAEPARVDRIREAVARFPNGTVGEVTAGDEGFSFRMTGCTFVDLLERIDRPGLAPLFCRGDRTFFERERPGLRFERPETLAGGADGCAFQLRWRDDR